MSALARVGFGLFRLLVTLIVVTALALGVVVCAALILVACGVHGG